MTVGTTRRRLLVAMAFLLPNLIGFGVFTAGPMVGSFVMSLTDMQLTKHNTYSDEPLQFVGLDNYTNLLVGPESERFWEYFGNTLFLMLGIPIGIAGSLVLALLITSKISPTGREHKLKLSAIVLGVTCVAAGVVWVTTSPGAVPVEDVLSVETGLTDMSAHQVDRLRSVAAVLATVGVGVIAVLGLGFGSMFFRTAYYLPSLLASVPMFLLWKTLYRPSGGVVNTIVDPVIDGAHGVVSGTPGWLWRGVGLLVWGGGVALGGKLVWGCARALRDRDIGVAGLIIQLTIIGSVVAVLGGGGAVLWELPGWAHEASALGHAGFNPPEWMVSSTWAKPGLLLMGVWFGVGGANMLLHIAGVSNIPQELYEAADIDGAAGWQRFINVTWPQLAPTTFFIVIMSTIGGLQGGFEQALIMTKGLYDTTVLTYYIYNLAFTDEFMLGLASAVAWVMFAMIFVMTVINYRIGSRLTNE